MKVTTMADNKLRRGPADRNKLSKGGEYDVAFFVRKHGIATEDAKRIITQHGSDRDACDKAAYRLK